MPSDVDPKFVIDFKRAVSDSLLEHSQGTTEIVALMASFLDPRFKALRFLSSSEKKSVHDSILAAVKDLYAEEVESPPLRKQVKTQTSDFLFDIQGSNDSNGSGNGTSSHAQ